jgi:hypothetical protein
MPQRDHPEHDQRNDVLPQDLDMSDDPFKSHPPTSDNCTTTPPSSAEGVNGSLAQPTTNDMDVDLVPGVNTSLDIDMQDATITRMSQNPSNAGILQILIDSEDMKKVLQRDAVPGPASDGDMEGVEHLPSQIDEDAPMRLDDHPPIMPQPNAAADDEHMDDVPAPAAQLPSQQGHGVATKTVPIQSIEIGQTSVLNQSQFVLPPNPVQLPLPRRADVAAAIPTPPGRINIDDLWRHFENYSSVQAFRDNVSTYGSVDENGWYSLFPRPWQAAAFPTWEEFIDAVPTCGIDPSFLFSLFRVDPSRHLEYMMTLFNYWGEIDLYNAYYFLNEDAEGNIFPAMVPRVPNNGSQSGPVSGTQNGPCNSSQDGPSNGSQNVRRHQS